MQLLTSTAVIVTLCCAMIAAITDLTTSKVYNVLTIPMVIAGLIYHSLTGGLIGLAGSFLGLIIGFGLVMLPFLMGGMGGGDVKLLAGIGAWVGVPAIFYVFIAAGLMAGVCAIVMLLWQKRSVARLAGDMRMMWCQFASLSQQTATEGWADHSITHSQPRRTVIPFGVLVAVAVIITFFYASWTGM